MTLVLFEFYLTARKALTNSIPLSGGAADVSGFARSFARSFRDAVLFGQGGADDVVRCTKVLRRPHHDDPATSTHRLLLSYSFLSLLLSTISFSIHLPSILPARQPFPPPKLCPVLRRKLLRGASLFWLPYFTDSDRPPCLPRSLPFYPFSSSLSPRPPFHKLPRPSLSSWPAYRGPLQSLLSLHSRPLVLYPILCYA